MDSITVTPRWVEHSPDFKRLMLGRIELAKLSRAGGSDWFVTWRFARHNEGVRFCRATESAACALAEAHARRMLGDV